ncbi:AP-1 complex subunit sigma-1A [Peromyscus eremicus]|uniref:AP-1 complex subunit sigma-1A n=1 Tax=Peromyscus eremicus TaxID=42410 RepID=UPI0027DE590D|nr:AP-1 complex subunit sigma-1A [Peromyscus eremicus]
MMRFMLLFSRQGKLRLQKWYLATSDKERKKMVRELMQVVLARKPKMCSFLEWRDLKVVYKRYASLYFCCAIEGQDNELITLELIHRYVELLDKYFGSVCELDIIFNFEKAYFILDEFLMGGDVQDTSKKSVLKAIEQADLLQEEDESPRSVLEENGPGIAPSASPGSLWNWGSRDKRQHLGAVSSHLSPSPFSGREPAAAFPPPPHLLWKELLRLQPFIQTFPPSTLYLSQRRL